MHYSRRVCWISLDQCQTSALCARFDKALEKDCGHCGFCETRKPTPYKCLNTGADKIDDSHALVKWVEGNELIARELLVDCVNDTTSPQGA